LRLHDVLLFKHLQRRRQLRFRLDPRAAVGQQPAQLLVAGRLIEFCLFLATQCDAAAQVRPGGPQRADLQLAVRHVQQAEGEVSFVGLS
jgi:hypothetical protein